WSASVHRLLPIGWPPPPGFDARPVAGVTAASTPSARPVASSRRRLVLENIFVTSSPWSITASTLGLEAFPSPRANASPRSGVSPDLGEAFARGDGNASRPSVEAVIDQGEEVTKMFSSTSLRRLLATGLAL